jgi:branched-chain amino acid transport system ATP-binding protein
MSLLTLENVTARYGAAQALFGVDLDLAEGEVVALMGRNGMGKTTTVKTICKMLPAGGKISFDGHDLSRLSSHQAARLGIGLVPEGRRCFRDLTVAENLIVAARPGDWTLQSVGALFPRLAERQGQRAATLSGGEQQMLAIGRALMTNPRLLILDEATEGIGAPDPGGNLGGDRAAQGRDRPVDPCHRQIAQGVASGGRPRGDPCSRAGGMVGGYGGARPRDQPAPCGRLRPFKNAYFALSAGRCTFFHRITPRMAG